MAKKGRTKKTLEKKEEHKEIVTEVFNIDGKDKIIETEVKSEEKPVGENEKKKEENIMKWILAFVGIVLVVVIITYYIVSSIGTFGYGGMSFSQEKYFNINFYHAKIPMLNSKDEIVRYADLYFRNDPRELKNIPVQGNINLRSPIVFNYNESVLKCNDSIIATGEFAQFMPVYGLNTQTIEYNESKDCNTPDATVMIVKQSDQNKITEDEKNPRCYVLEVKDCEVMKVYERFMYVAIAQAKGEEF